MKRIIAVLLLIAVGFTMAACGAEGETTSPAERYALKVCSADEALEWAKDTDTVVFEDGALTSGGGVWDDFYAAVGKNTPASVLLAHYYTLDEERVSSELYAREKDNYPVLFFCLVEFDGEEYSFTVRDSKGMETDHKGSFKYLLHFSGDNPPTARYDTYDAYVLVDDPTATWEGIWEGIYSSQSNAGYAHFFVYNNNIGLR